MWNYNLSNSDASVNLSPIASGQNNYFCVLTCNTKGNLYQIETTQPPAQNVATSIKTTLLCSYLSF